MPRNLGFGTVKPRGQNMFLIEGAKGILADDGTVTIFPASPESETWKTTNRPTPSLEYDVYALIESTETIEKIKGPYRCTVAPSIENKMAASFTKIE